MSIASRITQIEQHIGNAYDKIEDLGIDLTDVDKNINNISSMLENVWDEYPKITASDVEKASINGTKKGRININLKGNTEQDTLTGKNLLNAMATSYTLPANATTYKNIINDSTVLNKIHLEAGTKYYITYNVDNTSSSNTRSTPRLYLNAQYVQNPYNNSNLTAGRKVWEFTPTEAGDYEVQYWLQGSNVDVTISNFMISTSSDTAYEPYCGRNT